jgi:CRP/FNR family transcriptional regulator
MGDPLLSLYAVRRGSVKTNLLTQDGRVQVTAFYLPGELIGVDAIDEGRFPCDAIALEATELCEVAWAELNQLAERVPALNHQLIRLMSREIARDEELLMMLGHLGAEARLAACLLNFNARYKRLGASEDRFTLSMSRQDLGDYLGLALETVSRFFTRLHEEGLLEVQGRDVRVLDARRLRAMVSQPNGRRGLRA